MVFASTQGVNAADCMCGTPHFLYKGQAHKGPRQYSSGLVELEDDLPRGMVPKQEILSNDSLSL